MKTLQDEHTARGRRRKIYKIHPTTAVWPYWKATATTVRTRKRGKPRKRYTDEVQVDLNTVGIKKKGRQWPETDGNGERLYWKPRSKADCSASSGTEGVYSLHRHHHHHHLLLLFLLYSFSTAVGSVFGHGPSVAGVQTVEFVGRWYQPHAQSPNLEDRMSLFVPRLSQNLSSMCGPAITLATDDTAVELAGARKTFTRLNMPSTRWWQHRDTIHFLTCQRFLSFTFPVQRFTSYWRKDTGAQRSDKKTRKKT